MSDAERLNKPGQYSVQNEQSDKRKRNQILLWVGLSLFLLAFCVMLIFMVKMRADIGKNLPENISIADVRIARKHK